MQRYSPQVMVDKFIKDPDKKAKLAAIKQALASCDSRNPVFYEDEVDIHLNPKIGAD